MKKTTCFAARLVCLVFAFQCQFGMTQTCSPEAITAKYWQYRKNLEKHFIMNDRKPEGCIGNGITRSESDFSVLSCGTDLLHGYGLPATSIDMQPSGSEGMGERNWRHLENIESNPLNPFYNPDCANSVDTTISGISWNPPLPGHDSPFTGEKHNYLEYGSETPHQLGWYLVTLATEYELLGQNGQTAEQQRTLENIFLALQAYRRLDITANCLVKQRYDEITESFETDKCNIQVWGSWKEGACLCSERYHNGQCNNSSIFSSADSKWHFDIPCKQNCPWQPNLSGYSGFFIREDAVQEQEGLHDPSEDKWNIDLVGSVFAMSNIPPCTPNFSPACYMEKNTGFLSQDQLFSIMVGLAMIKRYIPPTATVTTCDGSHFAPLSIAQDIAKGMVDLPNNNTRHIFWPGSPDEDCCYKAVKFSGCAGGNLQPDYAGLQSMYNYINPGDKRRIKTLDNMKFNGFAYLYGAIKNPEFNLVLEAVTVGSDIGGFSNLKKSIILNYCNDKDKEIYLIMNNLLHPEGPQIDLDKSKFEAMLCEAPCGGVCVKPENYDEKRKADLDRPEAIEWPEFECSNTPKWTGQRWEGKDAIPEWGGIRQARQFNGLDFMALYNTYRLQFPEEQTPFYHPDRPEPISGGHLLGEDKIEGPTTLCPGQTGAYFLASTYPAPAVPDPLLWSSSPNITLVGIHDNPTSATMVTALTPSFLNVDFQETIHKVQYFNGDTLFGHHEIEDVCDFSYRKPIISEVLDYNFSSEIDPCQLTGHATARGYFANGIVLNWIATDSQTGWTATGSSQEFDFSNILALWPVGANAFVTVVLSVQTDCGIITKTVDVPYVICHQGSHERQIIITPNPANNSIAVRIAEDQTQDFITSDPNGVRIRIYPANGGSTTLMDSYLYANGQYFNVGSLPNGIYQVRAQASDLTPIQATLSIVH